MGSGIVVLVDDLQTITAGATINANTGLNQISSAAPVSTSTSQAIEAGEFVGQVVVLQNMGANAITIKNGAATLLPSGSDFVMNANDSVQLLWIGTVWVVIGSSKIGGGVSGVTSINTQTGAITFTGGTGISVTNTGGAFTITNTAPSTPPTGDDNTVAVFNASGALDDDPNLTFNFTTKIFSAGKQAVQPDTVQTLGAGFTVAVNKSYAPLTSTGVVTSSVSAAIAAGTVVGQRLLLENQGSNNITLKNAAGTNLPGNNDYTLNPRGMMELLWNGTLWRTISVSQN